MVPAKKSKTIQLDLFTNRGRGGRRTGAGRPRSKDSLQWHHTRPEFKPSQPLHINVKLIKGLPSLRAKNKFKLIKRAILKARVRGLRIIHFSIQSNHLHLLIESENKRELGRGMQSFCISLAKSLPEKIKLGLARVNTYALFKNRLDRQRFKEEMNLLLAPSQSWFLNLGWKLVK